MQITVEYFAGTYKGRRTVEAEDTDDAIRQVKGWVMRTMTLPMYAEGYKVVR